jgi:hypothetical protein
MSLRKSGPLWVAAWVIVAASLVCAQDSNSAQKVEKAAQQDSTPASQQKPAHVYTNEDFPEASSSSSNSSSSASAEPQTSSDAQADAGSSAAAGKPATSAPSADDSAEVKQAHAEAESWKQTLARRQSAMQQLQEQLKNATDQGTIDMLKQQINDLTTLSGQAQKGLDAAQQAEADARAKQAAQQQQQQSGGGPQPAASDQQAPPQ